MQKKKRTQAGNDKLNKRSRSDEETKGEAGDHRARKASTTQYWHTESTIPSLPSLALVEAVEVETVVLENRKVNRLEKRWVCVCAYV
jgi:hypothetical protein